MSHSPDVVVEAEACNRRYPTDGGVSRPPRYRSGRPEQAAPSFAAVTMTRRDKNGIESIGEVVSGIVLKRLGANTKATIDGIKERIPLITQALPEGVTFEPYYDQADLVTKAVDTVEIAAR